MSPRYIGRSRSTARKFPKRTLLKSPSGPKLSPRIVRISPLRATEGVTPVMRGGVPDAQSEKRANAISSFMPYLSEGEKLTDRPSSCSESSPTYRWRGTGSAEAPP